jgi:hypothetical protein
VPPVPPGSYAPVFKTLLEIFVRLVTALVGPIVGAKISKAHKNPATSDQFWSISTNTIPVTVGSG